MELMYKISGIDVQNYKPAMMVRVWFGIQCSYGKNRSDIVSDR